MQTVFRNGISWIGLGERFGRIVPLLAAILITGVMAIGCSEGAYPIDIFYEMHYQPSFASDEPPRLSSPKGAVPWFLEGSPIRNGETAEEAGNRLYDVNCSMCHGLKGGGDGPVLRIMKSKYDYIPKAEAKLAAASVQALPIETLETFILNGIDVMPAWGKLLSEQEIRLVARHIFTFPTNKMDNEANTGKELFATRCALCHGSEGKGDGPGIPDTYDPVVTPDLTAQFVQSQSPEALTDIIKNGLKLMPPWGSILTDSEIALLVEYILTLEGD